MRRLESSVLEIEKRLAPILVVAHQAPCRALRAYFLGLPLTEAMQAASADGAAALADGTQLLLELTPDAKVLGFSERVVPLRPMSPPGAAQSTEGGDNRDADRTRSFSEPSSACR